MKTKILTFFIVVLFFAFPVVGQNTSVPDVDSLGDIWVITIDNTYSMSRRGGKSIDMDAVGKGVEQRIVNSNAFDSINWGKDRFLILKSGIGDGTKRKFVDTQFIKHTDTVLHSYKNKGKFAGDIGNILAHSDYNNYVSFVSQMRLLSLCKALEFISDNGLQNKYRYINIVTISDDAVDQHDQWSTDYRTLKECCPDKVEYLSGLARKYIYNPLNGWGGGEMNLGWSDETRLPHIWLYHYVTSEGRLKMDTSNVYVDVVARDGKRLQFNVMEGETVPCLYWIDSVCVNKNVIKIGRHFTDSLTINAEYENDLINNVVAVYGKAQFEYNDSLLGPHYRVVDFVQHTTSMPRHLSITLNVLALVAILGVIIILLYLLWILPNKVLFDIYDATGQRNRVRRGYRWQWNGNIIPLLTLIIDSNKKTTTLALQNSKVETTNVYDNQGAGECNRVLIVSRRPVRVSADCTIHNSSKENIDNFYNTQADYPSLLKYCYRDSFEYKCYKMKCSNNAFARTVGKILLKLQIILRGSNNYYYYRQENSSVSIESSALKGKLFMIEKGTCLRGYENFGEYNIRKQLLEYFIGKNNTKKEKNSDVLLILSRTSSSRIWDVVLVNQTKNGQVSLCNVIWVYHYILQGYSDKKAIARECKALKHYLKQVYRRRVVFVNHLNANTADNVAMACFDITHAYSKRFLSLVTTEKNPVVTPIYDPFLDGQNKSKQFMITTNNKSLLNTSHLYCSFLPDYLLPKNNVQYRKKLSDTLVSFNGRNQAVTLSIEDDKNYRIHGMNITILQ